jgi:protein transport protein SEC31
MEAAPVATAAKHAGAVQGLDWNPSMTNLLASCGADGQLLVWDVGNTTKPLSVYSPGSRVKPVTDGMSCVAWNKNSNVPHILAGALSGGACEIWDLKNKKQVITFHDTKRSTRAGQRSLAWHPTEPTMIIQVRWELERYKSIDR